MAGAVALLWGASRFVVSFEDALDAVADGVGTIIETVFAYPGLGRLIVFSIQSRDIPTLQAAILVVVTIVATLALLPVSKGFFVAALWLIHRKPAV